MKWTAPITQRTRLTDAISVKRIATLKPWQFIYPYVVDGVNADDLRDYRPGIQAARTRGAIALSRSTKAEVRQLSQHLGLSWWDKPAQPA